SDDLARMEHAIATNDGPPLAWDVLRRRLQLSRTERTTLCLLLAAELSLDVAALVAQANKDAERSAIDIALLQRIVYANLEAAPRFVWEMSPQGALHRYRLVEIVEDR